MGRTAFGMVPILAAFLLAGLSRPVALLAQGSESTESYPDKVRATDEPRPGIDAEVRAQRFAVTRSTTGTLVEVAGGAETLALVEDDQGRLHPFKITRATRLSADKKVEGVDRKRLSLEDYTAGRTVRVTFRVSDSPATELQLRPPPAMLN